MLMLCRISPRHYRETISHSIWSSDDSDGTSQYESKAPFHSIPFEVCFEIKKYNYLFQSFLRCVFSYLSFQLTPLFSRILRPVALLQKPLDGIRVPLVCYLDLSSCPRRHRVASPRVVPRRSSSVMPALLESAALKRNYSQEWYCDAFAHTRTRGREWNTTVRSEAAAAAAVAVEEAETGRSKSSSTSIPPREFPVRDSYEGSTRSNGGRASSVRKDPGRYSSGRRSQSGFVKARRWERMALFTDFTQSSANGTPQFFNGWEFPTLSIPKSQPRQIVLLRI